MPMTEMFFAESRKRATGLLLGAHSVLGCAIERQALGNPDSTGTPSYLW